MKMKFKGSHFPKDVILKAIRWYTAYPLSYRHVEELMEERGIDVDHATVNRWVVKYSPSLESTFRQTKKPIGKSWRMDETYIKVKGQWVYYYRAVDKENQKFCLGLKQLEEDPWKRIEERMPVGSPVEGEAVRITEFGVFVELETGIEGLVHISEISEERVEKPSDKVAKGDKVKAIVISIDKTAKKIALSMKAIASGEYKSNYKPEVAQASTLADKLKGFKV